MPLLRQIRSPSLTLQDICKIQKCLTNIVLGLSDNKTVKADELFPFVHSTVASFLQSGRKLDELLEDACLSDDNSDDEGNESYATIYYLSRILVLSPAPAREYDKTDPSAMYPPLIHNVVMTLLHLLRLTSLTPQDLCKILEYLTNIVLGLSYNKSVKADELFLFVHSTVASSLQGGRSLDEILEEACLSDDDSDDEGDAILVTSGVKGSFHQVGITSKKIKTLVQLLLGTQHCTTPLKM